MDFNKRSQQKKTADKLEKSLAKELDARRIPGSGNIISWKGDVECMKYLLDSKNTETPIATLKASELAKIYKESRQADKEAGHIILTFLPDTHYAVVPRSDCNFESTEEYLQAKGSKKISKTLLSSMVKRGNKKNIIPSFHIHFEKMTLGTPRDWLIIPFDIYKEHFFE